MFVLLCFDIGNERWTTSGFLTRLSNGGPPQVPGTHAGTRGAGEFDGIIAAVKEDEIYYHRDQCDMITMILRLAAEPAWRYERGRQTTPAADRNRRFGGCGTRVIDQACPWERVLFVEGEWFIFSPFYFQPIFLPAGGQLARAVTP